ncbi:hypothetical protein SAMN02799616_04832 [Paenibacillus sp. UNC499MF]|nr:hypothetical protein SAMN02799616_04832 [Paenibacillus sp. UNC499MF]
MARGDEKYNSLKKQLSVLKHELDYVSNIDANDGWVIQMVIVDVIMVCINNKPKIEDTK